MEVLQGIAAISKLAMSRGLASTNQTFFAGEMVTPVFWNRELAE